MFVCHHCDNPSCVNPDHLFLGTAQDNADDCCAKGRQARLAGVANPRARLSVEEVAAIRSSAQSLRALSLDYSVHKNTIQAVRSGRNWRS
jgi:hypothetical protein